MIALAAVLIGVSIFLLVVIDRRITRRQYTPLWVELAVLCLISFSVIFFIATVAVALSGGLR